MKIILTTILLLTGYLAMAQTSPIGIFKNNADIGNPKIKGAAAFDAGTQTYQLNGGGYNIWFNRDEFHYLYNEIKGDFILTANVKLQGDGKDPHRKIGWMIRESDLNKAKKRTVPEQQNIEYIQSWHEDYLKWICGFEHLPAVRQVRKVV